MNEDFLDCWTMVQGEVVACVADGLGGMGGGEIASKLAVTKFKDYLMSNGVSEKTLHEAVRLSHSSILTAQQDSSAARMATTLTAVALSGNKILGVHCGDTRAVIVRGNGIKRLTKDHSEGQRLFDAGKISKDELINYPRKHILESALGDQEEPQIDPIWFDLLPGDRIILTTDGVHDLLLLRKMRSLCENSDSPDRLIQLVSSEVGALGPTDNYSMIALFADKGPNS
ncbi:PP2C family protein-serine/threonine phosphatase [Phaeobacter inhibens]|uniref:PP2C family protein-serine/threonine phosphatase n=1 Tax=Phaeobacter inhibens TaxID=221822 RepID=UPI001314BB09|nr:protein phosphatase 2C domain-containing protein [Phaeobacter inhibens]